MFFKLNKSQKSYYKSWQLFKIMIQYSYNRKTDKYFKGIDYMEKQYEKNINIRVQGSLRDAFVKTANDNGKQASVLLREFMQDYVDKYKQV